MTPSRLVIPTLIWACFFAAAAAQGDEEYDRTGIYIGAAGAYAFENFENGSSGVRARNELGYNVRAGYRAHSFVAVEVQFEHLPKFEFDVPNDTFGFDDADLELLTLTGNLKLIYPSGPLQPYALGGFGYMFADQGGARSGNSADYVTRFGGGRDLYFSDNIVGTLEGTYVLPLDEVNGLDYVSFTWGFQYRF
jgi:hypothetical protein